MDVVSYVDQGGLNVSKNNIHHAKYMVGWFMEYEGYQCFSSEKLEEIQTIAKGLREGISTHWSLEEFDFGHIIEGTVTVWQQVEV